ncbi:ABZJ_00895 family protein [Phyllobacterium sp. YR531]|uniref:ABZJ_00895 family protein n=1 Tax=Phyllobacterium sp. YR531 TaxID=1144343 RepID=UPI00026F5BC8|nr:ABZJ_00895 family protein [Phyllobacterium sp. YR531]EJN00021.1 hypothetical protein PMI41_03916 [Phyllobacterium sp. YR531]
MTVSDTVSTPVDLKKYVLMFGGILLFCQVVVIIITSVLQFDVPAAMGIIVVMAALSTPIMLFVKKYERVFTQRERVSFSNMAAIVAVIVTGALAAVGFYLTSLTGEASPLQPMLDGFSRDTGLPALTLLAGFAVFTMILTWILAYIETGWFARRALKKVLKEK